MQKQSVALIGTGEMGSAVAKQLSDGGCPVAALVEGRSDASRRRLGALGIRAIETTAELVERADVILCIVPPAQAPAVAKAVATALRAAPRALTYADCNAVSPATVRTIEDTFRSTDVAFVDAGIIGGPPRAGEPGPIFYLSGPDTTAITALRDAGLDIRVLGPKIGSASAIKMSYSGVTKGLTALGGLMRQHADAHGLEAELEAVLRETRPELARFLEWAIPNMRPKAYRWIAEMREIAAFAAPDDAGQYVYDGAARFFERVAGEAAVNGEPLH